MPLSDMLANAGVGVAANTANNALGTVMGLMLEHHNDKRQLNQQQKLQALQMQGQKEMTDYNMQKQMELWDKTNYSAQVEQLKKAGLNPALLYGMSGGGGTISNIAQGNVNSGQAPSGGHEILDAAQGMGIQQAMQIGLLQAQIDNIKADTANKQAENPNIPKQGQQIEANTGNIIADTEIKKVTKQLQQFDLNFKNASLNDTLEQIKQQARKTTGEATSALVKGNVDTNTRQTTEDNIRAQYISKIMEITLQEIAKRAGETNIQLDQQKILESANSIQQRWKSLSLEQQRIELTKEMQKYITNPSWNKFWNSLETSVGTAIGNITGAN